MTKHPALDVALWFLAKNQQALREYDEDMISNLKLQKLLYYAQGAFLGVYGKPLFSEDIEAWQHGPVVSPIYHTFKHFGNKGIDFDQVVDELSIAQNPMELFSPDETELLESIYENFGQYSAWKLRNMTHAEDPWLKTPPDQVIGNNLIATYFAQNYVEEA